MIDYQLLLAIFLGIAVLLSLILKFKIQAFVALLISSIIVGIAAGMQPIQIISTMQEGMGDTLGFVAVVVGLGAMFGAILEYSGGAEALAIYLLRLFGEKRASWAVMLTGFIVAIPVFFDVAFIILIPLIYSLQRKTGKSLLLYAVPLLAGLAITHSFIPPTPGPVAVADILKADLGWVILFGCIVGIPTAIISGPVFGKYIAGKIHVVAPEMVVAKEEHQPYPAVGLILVIIGIPILLIVLNTLVKSPLIPQDYISTEVREWLQMIGHPFTALIIANLLAWYLLGRRRGASRDQLMEITTKSMATAGIIILLTGAGGVFKQVLIETGTGKMLAGIFAKAGIGIYLFAYVMAALVRVLQGSATVAMITAAGIVAALLDNEVVGNNGEFLIYEVNAMGLALLVIAIASGATILSHVNDSGFWLVGKYLGLDEKQTFKSWSVMTTLLSIVGFSTVCLLSLCI